MHSLLEAGHDVRLLCCVYEKEMEKEGIVPQITERVFKNKEIRKVYKFQFQGIEVVSCCLADFEQILLDSDGRQKLEQNQKLWRWLADEGDFYEVDQLKEFVLWQIADFAPTHFIFNESVTLKICEDVKNVIRVFICHAAEHLPFGPYAAVPGFLAGTSEIERKRLASVECIVAVSTAVQKYIKRYGGLESVHVPLPRGVYGPGPFPCYKNFDGEDKCVVAINPGFVKGFTIFHEIVRRMPDVRFAAVQSWSTCQYVRSELEGFQNCDLWTPFKNMDDLLRKTKVLLVPSLWFEAFGLVCVEAMLRGVPVIASNAGGLVEATLGAGYNVPVKLINGEERHTHPADVRLYGIYKIPQQDATQWVDMLRQLLSDREAYERVSLQSRQAAIEFVDSLDVRQYEVLLSELMQNMKLSQESFLMPTASP